MLSSTSQPPRPTHHPPSRHDNPFATCWTRPGALAFRFADSESAEMLVARLAAQTWWGAIVGPHGSGKSTLLETLKPVITAAGGEFIAITLRDGQRRLPRELISRAVDHNTGAKPLLVIIDGYEQLGWRERARLARRCRRMSTGLLVTAHGATRISTLVRLAPERQLIEQLVDDLCTKVSTPITSKEVAASHACHGSNVREIFFELYDVHEQRRRAT